jgi:SAM-dependent methyltransferase
VFFVFFVSFVFLMMPQIDDWLTALEARHLADMRFSDVARALRALSSTYVERRERLADKGSLDSPGKRAAFALFYAPLHLLLVRAIVANLPGACEVKQILDLGCGTGAAGAGWATACAESPNALPDAARVRTGTTPRVIGLDRHPWTLAEAMFTYRAFELDGTTSRADVSRFRLPRGTDAVVAGFVANELDDAARAALLARLVDAARSGLRVLVVEPLATRVAPWWPEWAHTFEAMGGRADTWRIPVTLPDLVARLDRAAGLRHAELTGRTIWIQPA